MKNKIGLLFIFILIQTKFVDAQTPVINSVTSNSSTVGKYDKLELTVDLTATYTNPYDYSQFNLIATFTSPSGEIYNVDGFFYQDYNIENITSGELTLNGSPQWKIRFTPKETGTWQYTVSCTDANGTSNVVNQAFDCVTSNSKGFISKANNMFMKFDDGSQFFGIGENLCWNVNSSGGVDVNQTFVNYTEWIDTLTAYNGNLFRVWMSDWAFALECDDTPLRDYTNRQTNAFYLDWVIEYAETKNAYIELCFNHHGQFVESGNDAIWDENPYNIANGGPCANSYDFFTNTDAKNHYKNRLRYIVARWGYSTSIFAWEQFNEMDLIGNYWTHKADIANWTIEMAEYLKSLDVNNHLNTTSFVSSTLGSDIWNADVIDYTQTHYYNADAEIELELNNRTRTFLTDYNKPTKIGEYSLSTNGANVVISYDDKAIHVHNASWSTALSGSFSISMSWWWKWYINNQDANLRAYKHFAQVGNFMSSIDLLESPLTPCDFTCETNTSNAFYIVPGFGWGVAPENNFTVNSNGSLTPSADNLSKFLYGDTVNTNLKNPPTFNVDYPQDGYFTVKTGDATEYNPTIEIWLDGTKILDQAAIINTNYTIAVPAGTHQIFVDNKGHDWIKIEKYYSSYDTSAVNAKSNGLICSNSAYGWVHNRNYNWEYISTNGEPASINNARIIIPGLNDGDYNITFYNTFTGDVVSQEIGTSISGILYANIPDMLWDFAFKITETTTSSKKIINDSNSNILVYPNPAKNILKIKIPDNSNYQRLEIFDALGKQMCEKTIDNREITLDISSCKNGIYNIVLKSQTNKIASKLIINK